MLMFAAIWLARGFKSDTYKNRIIMRAKRYSCWIECSRCVKTFKNSRTIWGHMLKSHQLDMTPLQFLDENSRPVKLIEPKLITLASELDHYNEWLITVVERINEALHPALPGRYYHQQ